MARKSRDDPDVGQLLRILVRYEGSILNATNSNNDALVPICTRYHMHGSEIGSLNVYVNEGSVLTNPKWSRNGAQGDRWLRGYMDITTSVKFQVKFGKYCVNPSIVRLLNIG